MGIVLTTAGDLGLPAGIGGLLFDMDGVLTDTSGLHTHAWKDTFDDYLRDKDGSGFTPFSAEHDYPQYVDGLPRLDGVRSFLRSRHIDADEKLVLRLGDNKDARLKELIDETGVRAYPGSLRYLEACRSAGLPCAVVSSSANAKAFLESAGLTGFLDARIDGVTLHERNIPGKPAPDMFLAGADAIGVRPEHAAVFEDALSGVSAGHSGHFGFVIGVNRANQADALKEHGADRVVNDLAELLEKV
ncbi:beta-phosphoglucomutase family hydrolase [Pseudonocardiaceae bacterium YIM PH 21723]|nr:beta-phosphoglucomutase family hydrolase [Pseudonocardiaceae bacterium YIM PH 21723]